MPAKPVSKNYSICLFLSRFLKISRDTPCLSFKKKLLSPTLKSFKHILPLLLCYNPNVVVVCLSGTINILVENFL